jgi:hypothetical protein
MAGKDKLTYLCGGEIDAGDFSLSIWSEALEPAEINQLLGMEPTEQYRRGDFKRTCKVQFNHGSWEFSTGRLDFRSGKSCEESFDYFVRSLPDLPEAWGRIVADHTARITIVLWMRTCNRELDISRFALGELAKRHLSVHIDTYLEEDNEETRIANELPGVDAGWRLLFAFLRSWSRATQAGP